MSSLINAIACILTLGAATFLWKRKSFYLNGALIVLFLFIFCLFTYFGFELYDIKNPALEHYPFRMLAFTLCLSTTSLKIHRRRYLVLSCLLWCLIEVFGGISLYYRGYDFCYSRVVALFSMFFFSGFLSKISKEMEFCLMVFWIGIWIFF